MKHKWLIISLVVIVFLTILTIALNRFVFPTMIKKIAIGFIAFILIYVGIVQIQVHFGHWIRPHAEDESKPLHKVYTFSFAKYTQNGEKEIEIDVALMQTPRSDTMSLGPEHVEMSLDTARMSAYATSLGDSRHISASPR